MLKCIFLLLLSGFALSSFGQSAIYNQSVTNIDGGQVMLNSYAGKKVLFIIAPARLADTAKVDELVAFNTRYGDTVKLIGIMSLEDGFEDSNKVAIKSMYQSRGVNIVLTQGMYTKKSSANQSAIMQWLTKRTMNKRFDDDAGGVGQQFYVDENGKLFSVLIAQTDLFSPAVERNVFRKQ